MYKRTILLWVLLFTAIVSAQVKIGGTDGIPNANAMLEIEAVSKGFLLPRVALTSTALSAPLGAHVAGMTVYNTATVGTGITAVTPGQYYNDGTKWNRIVNSNETPATVTASNALTKTANNIALGGHLETPTVIKTARNATDTGANTANTLAITGLQQTTTLVTDKVVVMDTNGVLKIANASDFATSKNTTVFKAFKAGTWSLLALGGGWNTVPLLATDKQIGATTLLNANGEYVAPSKGIYKIKYELRMQGVNAALLGSSYLGLIKNGSTTAVEEKPMEALTVNIALVINIADIPISGSTLDTVLELNAGDRIAFGFKTGINLGLLSSKQISCYIYKISDL